LSHTVISNRRDDQQLAGGGKMHYKLWASHLFRMLLLAMVLLPGCALHKTRPPGAEPGSEPVVVSPPAAPLLASARLALDRHDLNGAEAYLERAIRIETRNPLLWHTLAQTKYRQGDFAQAIQLCLRSNSLLPQAAPLARENFLLMALAYRQLGQEEKARQASQQAGTP
jgi:tetratricopeptide (TPR) repeat protein